MDNQTQTPQKKSSTILRKVVIILTVYAIALLVSSVQILPTQELTIKSQRAKMSLEVSQTESLSPDSLWAIIYPNHNNVARGDYIGPWDKTQNNLYLTPIFVMLAILGVIFGIINKNNRKLTIFFIILAVSSVFYSLGKHSFLQKYFYQFIPLFDKIRAPSNMMILFNLAIIGLSSLFMDYISKFIKSKTNPAKAKLLVTFISGFIFTISVASILNAVLPNELLYARKNPEKITDTPLIARNILLEYRSLEENNKFRTFKIPEFLNNSTQMQKIYSFDGYNPLTLTRHSDYTDAMVRNPNLVDLAGIKYLPCQFIPERAKDLKKVGDLCINEDYLPRAFFVNQFISAKNSTEALQKLNDTDIRKTVILEDSSGINFSNTTDANNELIQKITITETNSQSWKLDITTNADAILFFGQTNYPGWTATIDDSSATIYQANYLFQAIITPAGNHEIVFKYHSKSLKLGAILTIIGLIIVSINTIYVSYISLAKPKTNG